MIDNYDSFTYNLVHLVKELGAQVSVFRNDRFALEELAAFDKLMLSPGPGIPSEAGLMPAAIRRYAVQKPILGICLGEQALGEAFGGTLINLEHVFHGVQTPCRRVADDYLFAGLPEEFPVGRYHSWGRRDAPRLPGVHRRQPRGTGDGTAPPDAGPARPAVPPRERAHPGRRTHHFQLVESLKKTTI